MKLSVFLPILASGESKRDKKQEGDKSVKRAFVASEVTNQCSTVVSNLGGRFDTPILNPDRPQSSGRLILWDYPENFNCKHVVQADSTCEEIEISYRTIAVEPSWPFCGYDSFRFGWAGVNGFDVTPGRCSCFGGGCFSEFDGIEEYFGGRSDASTLGPDTFSVDSNNFTFYFESDHSGAKGHVGFDWECVRYRTTTTTTTTTRRTTTSTATTAM